MRNNILITLALLFISCFLFACTEKELAEDAVFDPRYPETDAICKQAGDLLSQADHIFMHDNYLVELYTQTSTDKKIQIVPNFENIPKDLASTFNVIRNKEGNIMYVAEFPYSESGDWENIYESVFDENGDLLLLVRKSSFMLGDAVIHEKSQYFYNSDHKLVKKTYELKDKNDTDIPSTTKIDFAYRFEYKKYTTRKKWLKAHDLDK